MEKHFFHILFYFFGFLQLLTFITWKIFYLKESEKNT